MNEAQTFINLEKFMSSVCRKDYYWKNFASDYDQYWTMQGLSMMKNLNIVL